jgi:hypothetical protein
MIRAVTSSSSTIQLIQSHTPPAVQQLHIFTGQPHQGYIPKSSSPLQLAENHSVSSATASPSKGMSPLAKVLVALVALASVAELAAGKNYTIQWAASGNSYGDWSAANPVRVGDTVGEVPVLSTYLSSMQLGTSLHRSSEIFTRFHWCSVHVRGAAHRRRAVAAGLRGLQLRQADVAGRQRPHRHHVPHGWHQVLRRGGSCCLLIELTPERTVLLVLICVCNILRADLQCSMPFVSRYVLELKFKKSFCCVLCCNSCFKLHSS